MSDTPLRILIYALGGEGGGVLMNWIVAAARASGREVQATSVPGVAQRTGSTTYYVEIGGAGETAVFSLMPMPGRVDVVLASELVEAGRALGGGYVSPGLTTLIASTGRTYTTAEKIRMADGRYPAEGVEAAARALAKTAHLYDFGALAEAKGTFISATLFGALAGSGVLPWDIEFSRSVVEGGASEAGFDAAARAVAENETLSGPVSAPEAGAQSDLDDLPEPVRAVADLGRARCADFQDDDYGALYLDRLRRLAAAAPDTHEGVHALTEAARRLALWMAYEDIARVADLKTRPERFDRIRAEARTAKGQLLRVTEYLKPRAEEVADILPEAWGSRLMARAQSGKVVPFLGAGRHVRSNGVLGYRLLRLAAGLRRFRRGSLRYKVEQAAIEAWLRDLERTFPRSTAFAAALAELPRVRKGYSDTLARGLRAYEGITAKIIRPAIATGTEAANADWVRRAIAAAMSDEDHAALSGVLSEESEA